MIAWFTALSTSWKSTDVVISKDCFFAIASAPPAGGQAEPEAAYFRYYLRFGDNWHPTVSGGKLPGLLGGAGNTGGSRPDGTYSEEVNYEEDGVVVEWEEEGDGEGNVLAVNVGVAVLTGASLTLVTVTLMACESVPPLPSLTWTVTS